jgi:hypothetical protein
MHYDTGVILAVWNWELRSGGRRSVVDNDSWCRDMCAVVYVGMFTIYESLYPSRLIRPPRKGR